MSQRSFRFTAAEIATLVGAALEGNADVTISGLAGVDDAADGDLTFLSDPRYAAKWTGCHASAAVIAAGLNVPVDHRPLLRVANVEQAMIALLDAFSVSDPGPELGVHPTAVVHESATIGHACRIAPHVSIGAEVVLGDAVTLHPGVCLYRGVRIGDGSVLHANTVVRERCVIGRGVILHQNVSIGADGFGYRPAPDGRGLLKMPHIGIVRVDDGVEVGANSCIDRAKFGVTHIGAGTKIDNLCQIAHNCRIGRACAIAGNVGIAGSVVIGDGVMIGGGSGVSDHLTIGSGARIGAMTLVTKDLAAGATCLGLPADESHAALRQWASVRKLPQVLRQLAAQGLLNSDVGPKASRPPAVQ